MSSDVPVTSVEPDQTVGSIGRSRWLTRGRAARIAWTAVVVAGAVYVVAVGGELRAGPDVLPIDYGGALANLVSVAFVGMVTGIVGAIIVAGRPIHRLGWLFVITALVGAILALGFYWARWVGVTSSPQAELVAVAVNAIIQPFIFISGALVLLWFPDGHLPSPRWRWAVLVVVAGGVVRGLENLAAPLMPIYPTVSNPTSIEGPIGSVLDASYDISLGITLQTLGLLLGALSLVDRYVGADRTLRRQIRWVVAASIVTTVLAAPLTYITIAFGTSDLTAEWALVLFFLGYSLIPISCLIAITRHRLFEIDRIVNRAVLYGLLTAVLAGLFAGIVTLSERLLVAVSGISSDVTVILAAVVVTMTYHPVRRRIEAFVDKRFRYEAGHLGAYEQELRRVLDVVDPERALDRLLRESVAAVDASGGAIDGTPMIAGQAGRMVVGAWTPDATVVAIPITHGSRSWGELMLAGQVDGEPYTDEEVSSLRSVAALVAAGLDVVAPPYAGREPP